ncbi:MAG: amino acid ABC transporter permease [Anaerolineales bacterium]|nr:amino acid ABC transporter permease [Anaerolineales bacterium]MDW8278515.1 amino acid ABC transporter permease [Anaerolineales bacterium]
MNDTADTKQNTPSVSLGEALYAAEQRRERVFRIHVGVSWLVMFALLMFLFSGQTLTLGSLEFNTIRLDFDFIQRNLAFVAGGMGQTILISVLSILLATLLALVAALGRLSRFPPFYAISTFYVSLIRGTPLYLQIFFFFLALPQLGIILPGFIAGVVALGLNYGAYMSEIFRAGIGSVGKGQREAALALGMTPVQVMRRIVIPQALRFAIPPMGNEFIAMTKDSALVSATGFVHELMWRATKVGRANFKNLEALIMAAVFYWLMTMILSYIQGKIEARMAKGDR